MPGMAVPGASDLGLGSMLAGDVKDETEDERKKRMAAIAQQRMMGTTAGISSLVPDAYTGMGGLGGR